MFRRKYRNTKVTVNGMIFDSKQEYRRYELLTTLQDIGQVTELVRQPRFVLMDGYRDSDGKWIRPITYTADFQYTDSNGQVVVEDVKSFITAQDPTYRLKKKLFHKLYPQYIFREWTGK